MDRKNTEDGVEAIVYCVALLLAGIGSFLLLYFSFSHPFNDGSAILNPSLASDFGGFVGGLVGSIFSLSGVLLLFVTLLKQQRSLRVQRKEFQVQQFENHLFQAIQLHRENVSEMVHRKPNANDEKIVSGRMVFHEIYAQYKELYKELNSGGIEGVIPEAKLIDVSWMILYFGTSKSSREMLGKMLEKVLPKNEAKAVLELVGDKPTYYNHTIKFYGGHQIRLGHYFRHLIQSVRFIDKQKVISQEEKYQYAKLLRAQLSTVEQVVLFLNSMSQLGKAWGKKVDDEDTSLIERYAMIKNIPEGYLMPINPKKYYPKLPFDKWK